MNLLNADADWIPVMDVDYKNDALISLKTLLTSDCDYQLAIPRDDMELAALQLLICLVQVVFTPANSDEWRRRMEFPLTEIEYDSAVLPMMDWFDLCHPQYPFMQSRGVTAAECTPIQKLLIGLPEGNNHAFFNGVGEVQHLSEGMTAIALFNQASNCPSFGGGFKGGLRGVPITTLVAGQSLRQTLWCNVLHEDSLRTHFTDYDKYKKQPPVWVEPIKAGQKIALSEIGLLRGLFWQPLRVELLLGTEPKPCDVMGGKSIVGFEGFNKEKFVFEVVGQGVWPHPHSPRWLDLKKQDEKFLAFTTSAPAWTQCLHYLFAESDGKSEGYMPAAVIGQWSREVVQRDLLLLVGGYRNKQASVIERRHELFTIGSDWQSPLGKQYLYAGVKFALQVKTLLRSKLFSAVKGNKEKFLKGLGVPVHEHAEKRFYQDSYEHILDCFSAIETKKEAKGALDRFKKEIVENCCSAFEDAIAPYQHNPALIKTIALTRRNLSIELHKLTAAKE